MLLALIVSLSPSCHFIFPRYSRSMRYTRHNSEELLDAKGEKDDSRYEGQLVVPLLSCDPLAILVQMWLWLCHQHKSGALHCLLVYLYRVVIVQSVMSALRDLGSRERREAVVMSSTSKLAPLLQLVYSFFKHQDVTVFYRYG